MVSGEHKLNGDDRDVEGSGEQETTFQDDSETVKFLPDKDGDASGDKPKKQEESTNADFQGLTREELDQFAADPKWVKIRWILFIIFIVGWVAMLVIAIIIVIVTPKCPPAPELTWYEEGVAYSVNVENFKDSNADGTGDINGMLYSVSLCEVI